MGKCRSVSEFEKLNRIGEGTYGVVCKFIRERDKVFVSRYFYNLKYLIIFIMCRSGKRHKIQQGCGIEENENGKRKGWISC